MVETIQHSDNITIQNCIARNNSNNYKAEIIAGLTDTQKRISSSLFYDEIGSRLFEKITKLSEYYPPRIEKPLLEKLAEHLRSELDNIDLIEIGSGDCSKISILLDGVIKFSSIRYIPFDISKNAIIKSAEILANKYGSLKIHGMVADFYTQLGLIPNSKRRIFCFFGSTIGNFDRDEAKIFLKEFSNNMNQNDYLIIGFDMVKSVGILHRAYNDEQGITAKFNQNILNVVNKQIASNFNTEDFEHYAFYNAGKNRIEMHLQAKREITLSSPNLPDIICIGKGETIHTENSYKFTNQMIEDLVDSSDLCIKELFSDDEQWFTEVLLTKK